jgi:hypothetical protein
MSYYTTNPIFINAHQTRAASLIFATEYQDGANRLIIRLYEDWYLTILVIDGMHNPAYNSTNCLEGVPMWSSISSYDVSAEARAHIDQLVKRVWEMRLFL